MCGERRECEGRKLLAYLDDFLKCQVRKTPGCALPKYGRSDRE